MSCLCSLVDGYKQSGGDCCLLLQDSRINCVEKNVMYMVKGGSKFPYSVGMLDITLFKIIILMLMSVSMAHICISNFV